MRSLQRKDLVIEIVRKNKNLPNRTIAKIAYAKYPQLFPNLEAARDSVRLIRGNHGNIRGTQRAKPVQGLIRPNGIAGTVWKMPESIADTYEPFILETRKNLVISDIHIPFHDPAAMRAFFLYADRIKPDSIVLNGDTADFYSSSKFDKCPTITKFKHEIDSIRAFLGYLRQRYANSRIIYKLGNHDERFDKYLWAKAPELFGVVGVSLQHLTTGKIDSIDGVPSIEWVSDKRKIMIGRLAVWHGHELGGSPFGLPASPARTLFLKTGETGVCGHFHKETNHTFTRTTKNLVKNWSTGCMCGLYPPYLPVNQWSQGFVDVTLHDAGAFTLKPVGVLNGKIL